MPRPAPSPLLPSCLLMALLPWPRHIARISRIYPYDTWRGTNVTVRSGENPYFVIRIPSTSELLGEIIRRSGREVQSGRFRSRQVPARVQEGRPGRRGVGPGAGTSADAVGGPLPGLHDGHRVPHGDLPAGPAGHAGRQRTRRDRVPVVLGLRGAVARRGVQPVPRRGGVRAGTGRRARVRRLAVPVALRAELPHPRATGGQGDLV